MQHMTVYELFNLTEKTSIVIHSIFIAITIIIWKFMAREALAKHAA